MSTYRAVCKLSGGQKWGIAVAGGVLFGILSLPLVYGGTNSIAKQLKLPNTFNPGGPTMTGIIVNVIIFIILFRIILALIA